MLLYGSLPPGFLGSLVVFLPKDAGELFARLLGSCQASREPGDTRPITLANTDYKLCAGQMVSPITAQPEL
eukprot:1860187-Lingulodinium_polyedra.AAC.1